MTERLLLDEHFPPVLAQKLRKAGFDAVAVSELPDLQGAADEQVYQVAVAQGRRVVTENVRDFRPLLMVALSGDNPYAPLLLTTARKYPRRISALAALDEALSVWLEKTDPPKHPEEWL